MVWQMQFLCGQCRERGAALVKLLEHSYPSHTHIGMSLKVGFFFPCYILTSRAVSWERLHLRPAHHYTTVLSASESKYMEIPQSWRQGFLSFSLPEIRVLVFSYSADLISLLVLYAAGINCQDELPDFPGSPVRCIKSKTKPMNPTVLSYCLESVH